MTLKAIPQPNQESQKSTAPGSAPDDALRQGVVREMKRIEPYQNCFLSLASTVDWEATHTSECIAHIIPSHRPLLALHHFVIFPSEGILKTWFGTSGLWTSNIDLSTAQRTFPTDQRKSGLPKVLPAYKNGLRTRFSSSPRQKNMLLDFDLFFHREHRRE